MRLHSCTTLSTRKKADLIVLPCWQGKKIPETATDAGALEQECARLFKTGDFNALANECVILYPKSQKEPRLLLLGLGQRTQASTETLRQGYAAACNAALACGATKLNLLLPEALSPEEQALGCAEGMLLTNYRFELNKGKGYKPTPLLKDLCFVGLSRPQMRIVKEAQAVCEGVYLARDLVNGNADTVTPQYLAKTAQGLAKKFPKVKCRVFNKKRIEKENLNLLLSVARGGNVEPAFIIVDYDGNPSSKKRTVLVGKGITYDTGGLNMKPTGRMETMRADMGGAATVLGTLFAAASSGLRSNLTVVIPSCENGVSSKSYKPGDIYSSYSGKTVEIGNTDAEGRLILADALAYTCKKLKPTRIIDVATLTGAVRMALGDQAAAVLSNDDKLAQGLHMAGKRCNELFWPLPLIDAYRDNLKSDFADIRNTGGPGGGCIIAGLFLSEFVTDVPWLHLDIASVAYRNKAQHYHPQYGTGIGVRTLIEYLRRSS